MNILSCQSFLARTAALQTRQNSQNSGGIECTTHCQFLMVVFFFYGPVEQTLPHIWNLEVATVMIFCHK